MGAVAARRARDARERDGPRQRPRLAQGRDGRRRRRVEIAEPPALAALVPDPEVKIEVLFRDPAVLVVNKPAPMACHPLRPGERGTVMNGVAYAFPEAATAGDNPREGGLVHRLDNGTSGALLVALTPTAFAALREAIRAGRIRRDYQALVADNLKESLQIDKSLAHDPHNARRMIARCRECARRTRRRNGGRADTPLWKFHPGLGKAAHRDAPSDSRTPGSRRAIRSRAIRSMEDRRSRRSPTAASGSILRKSNFARPPQARCEYAPRSRATSKPRSRKRAAARALSRPVRFDFASS